MPYDGVCRDITSLFSLAGASRNSHNNLDFKTPGRDGLVCAISDDKRWIVTGSQSGEVQVENVDVEDVQLIESGKSPITSIHLNPSGKTFATLTYDGIVKICKLPSLHGSSWSSFDESLSGIYSDCTTNSESQSMIGEAF